MCYLHLSSKISSLITSVYGEPKTKTFNRICLFGKQKIFQSGILDTEDAVGLFNVMYEMYSPSV